ncbi:hypothetical protein [Turicibacter sanguinis]|uniref:hypothetical protein n=1 Tax=Turicibacter sanguinis TaxID=154288 RepID=UPI0018AA513E|nr:hypothetical protein [Turicibacter sanguinis]MDB8558241.1 hypothetical protein [Turicibacter sanguinis]MDB8561017.1 hypothetical protein [Turicibacter sanguinis]
MGKKFSYLVYGLKVLSDIECPELVELDELREDEYDVLIEVGQVSAEIHERIEEGRGSSYTNESMWFHIKEIATYWMRDGNLISIELCDEANLQMAKQYLLGSCLGMIMLQRNMIAIHGGTIVFDGKGVIFTGDRGAGKSTITSALRLKGYPFVADDVSSVEAGPPHFIHPGFPQQKLCQDTMRKLGYSLDGFKTLMSDTQIKYLIPARESFVYDKVPLHGIVELKVNDELDEIRLSILSGQEKFMTIYNNIYRIEMKRFAGVNPEYFKKCVEITKDIPVYRIERPKGVMTVDAQIKWLEETFLVKEERLEA